MPRTKTFLRTILEPMAVAIALAVVARAAVHIYSIPSRSMAPTLEPGDQIVIGPVVFTVQIDGEPADDEIIQIRTKLAASEVAKTRGGASSVGTSKHVYMSDDEVDPISALEALASSADQTAINPEDDE